MKNHYWESRKTMTPRKSLQFLKEGNERFVNNLRLHHDLLEMANRSADGQFPFATVLSCSDSRTTAEFIFDQGLGDVFSIRLAGNIASLNAIASMEFSCRILGSKLIVVLGHTHCGAIKGACDKVEMGNLAVLLEHIYPAVERETKVIHNRSSYNKTFVENVTRENIRYQKEVILQQSDLLREMVRNEEIGIIGGLYDLHTGKVTFYEDEAIFSFPEAPISSAKAAR